MPSFVGPVMAVLAAIVCMLALRNERAAMARKHAELLSMLRGQRDENAQQIAQLTQGVEVLQRSQRSAEEACNGLSRSRRSQAMQLLRSGMSPESAASSLGLATREMRLIAKVSRMLTLP